MNCRAGEDIPAIFEETVHFHPRRRLKSGSAGGVRAGGDFGERAEL
jgi:hypothetical protein